MDSASGAPLDQVTAPPADPQPWQSCPLLAVIAVNTLDQAQQVQFRAASFLVSSQSGAEP
jgi:hypothetical protein